MSVKLKARSPMYLRQMSEKVHSELEKAEKKTNMAKWLIVEKILEDTFNIEDNGIDIEKFLGITPQRAKMGKAVKKVRGY